MDMKPNITIDADAIVCLVPPDPALDVELEAVADWLQELLDETPELLALTEGASVGANFCERRVEIDVCFQGTSKAEIQEQLARLLVALEKHLAAAIARAPQPSEPDPVGEHVTLSGTQVAYA